MTHTRADELAVVKLLTSDYSPGFIATANHMLEADVKRIAERYGWPDKERLGWAVDELTRAADENEQRRITARETDPETVPAVTTRPKVVATVKPAAAAVVDVDQDDEEPEPAEDFSPPTLEALVFRASGSGSKRTQSLGKRISELAAELRERLDAEEQERQAREEQEKERAAVAAELAAAEKALAEARAKAAQLRGKPAPTSTRTPTVVRAHEPKVVRAWAAANGVACPDRGRVPGRVVEAWAAAQ